MRERVLLLNLAGTIEAFASIRWKFFDIIEEAKLVVVEVPRGLDESYVVELPFIDEDDLEHVVDELFACGFIRQSKRVTNTW